MCRNVIRRAGSFICLLEVSLSSLWLRGSAAEAGGGCCISITPFKVLHITQKHIQGTFNTESLQSARLRLWSSELNANISSRAASWRHRRGLHNSTCLIYHFNTFEGFSFFNKCLFQFNYFPINPLRAPQTHNILQWQIYDVNTTVNKQPKNVLLWRF